jgi:hypothetical protein
MRTTDVCFPLLRLRAPALRELPASLRGLRLALDLRACFPQPGGRWTKRFHDAQSASAGPPRLALGIISSVRFQIDQTSNAPVAPVPTPPRFRMRGRVRVAKTALDPSLREEKQAPQPEASSIDRGHSRACANRRWLRERPRECSASSQRSAPFHLRLPPGAFTPNAMSTG